MHQSVVEGERAADREASRQSSSIVRVSSGRIDSSSTKLCWCYVLIPRQGLSFQHCERLLYEPVGVAALQCLLISSKATAVATLMYNKKVGKRGLPSPSQNSIESLVVVVVVIEQQQHTVQTLYLQKAGGN